DNDAVSKAKHFVQFRRHKQDSGATIAESDQLFMDEFRCANIYAASRLCNKQQFGVNVELPGDDQLLLVTTGQGAGRKPEIGRPDVILPSHPAGSVVDHAPVEQQAARDRLFPVDSQNRVVGKIELENKTATMTILGYVGDADPPALPRPQSIEGTTLEGGFTAGFSLESR